MIFQDDVNQTISICENLIDLCNKYKRSLSIASNVWHIFAKRDYNEYSDRML